MVAQKSEADEKLRQSEADIEGLKAALESSIEAMASGFRKSRPLNILYIYGISVRRRHTCAHFTHPHGGYKII